MKFDTFLTCELYVNRSAEDKNKTFTHVPSLADWNSADLSALNQSVILTISSSNLNIEAYLRPLTISYLTPGLLSLACLLYLIIICFFKPKRTMYNISEWLILQQFAFILSASAYYMIVSLKQYDTPLKYLFAIGLIQIVLSLFFLRNYEGVMKSFTLKNKLLLLSAFVFLGAYLYLIWHYYNYVRFWVFEGALLLGVQIVHSFRNGGRGGIEKMLLAIIFVTRFPLFSSINQSAEEGSFFELIRMDSNSSLVWVFNASIGLWLSIMLLQHFFGARFFIPKELIPDYFDYFDEKGEEYEEKMSETCSICCNLLKD